MWLFIMFDGVMMLMLVFVCVCVCLIRILIVLLLIMQLFLLSMLFWLWFVYGLSVMLVSMLSLGKCFFSLCMVCGIRFLGLVVLWLLGVFSDGLMVGNSDSMGMLSLMYCLVICISRLIDMCLMLGIDGMGWCCWVFLMMNIGQIRLLVVRWFLCIRWWEKLLWCIWCG